MLAHKNHYRTENASPCPYPDENKMTDESGGALVHVVRVITALVNATRFITATRGMQCTDKLLQRFVDAFEKNELLLNNASLGNLCTGCARYMTGDDDLPPTMSRLAEAMRPAIFLSTPGALRHRGVASYDVLFVAFCAEDTAVLAKRVVSLSTELLEVCKRVQNARRSRKTIAGRIVLVHANEKSYDNVPPVAKAAAISGKKILPSVTIEFFYAAELQFDRLVHQEVPDHMPLDVLLDNAPHNEAVRRELERDSLRGWRIVERMIERRETHKLPVIKREDIIARLFGVQSGQIVRVETRDKELGGTTFEYHQIE